jgi:hypothetical protein
MRVTSASAAVLAAIGLFALAAPASAAVVNDTTPNVSYWTTHVTNWFGGGTTSVGDVIEDAPRFDTQKVDISVEGQTLRLKYYTQFDGSFAGTHYADVFLATDPHNPDVFDYGISLGGQIANGGVAAGFYALAPGDYKTSMDIWGSQPPNIYGGKYISPNDDAAHDAPTAIRGGLDMPAWQVSVVQSPSGDAGYPFVLDIALTAPDAQAFYDVFNGLSLSAFWGTADCNNDAVYASLAIPRHQVPEPGSMALLAGGLLGLGGLRRRRSHGKLQRARAIDGV